MPTTTCVHCTGNGSTLGPLGKHWRVRADPAPGWDNADLPELPKSETSAVSESASPLWLGSMRNKKTSEKWKVEKSESWKLSGNACSEGGNEAGCYSSVLATLTHSLYTLKGWSVCWKLQGRVILLSSFACAPTPARPVQLWRAPPMLGF